VRINRDRTYPRLPGPCYIVVTSAQRGVSARATPRAARSQGSRDGDTVRTRAPGAMVIWIGQAVSSATARLVSRASSRNGPAAREPRSLGLFVTDTRGDPSEQTISVSTS